MGPVDGGVGGDRRLDPPADGGTIPAGSTTHAPRRRRDNVSPAVVGAVCAAFVALGVGLAVGGVVFGGGQSGDPLDAAQPQPSATVTVTADPPAGAALAVGPAADPTRLVIPDLGIDQGLIDLFVSEKGVMDVPPTAREIGWWQDGPAPGEPGGSILAAHVNYDGEPGAFAELGSMVPGQEIVVDRADGTTATYAVASVEQFSKDDFPDERVYTYEGPTQLHLVTCGGPFDRVTGHYEDNIVVFADLVSDSRTPAGA